MAGNPIVFILLFPLAISFPGKELLPLGVSQFFYLWLFLFGGKESAPRYFQFFSFDNF
jgi:hypothetical protein